jgi:hypothetical protein
MASTIAATVIALPIDVDGTKALISVYRVNP